MINKESLTEEWIDKVSKANRNADKILVEKVIRALLLLEGLSRSGLSFIFKGGTALMLLLDSAKRLSIDIDIILTEKKDNLDELLKAFAEAQGFRRVELQHRAAAIAIEKAHYKFFYTPVHNTVGEEAILLDILFEANHYKNIQPQEIKSGFLITSAKPASVNMPSLEDLLGDKLTAFAPNTTGIPYFKKEDSMSMEIIKQLYDIGTIFDVAEDFDTVKATFNRIAATEIVYRELKEGKPADVLDDIYQTSLCLCLRGAVDNENFDQLQKGIQRVERFIFSESYHLDKAIVHAAKAAYLSRLIATDQKAFEKFADPKQLAKAIIEQPHNTKLNKLKKSSPEAFFYWWKAISLS
ncbi:MAG: nucleotidyl transferase AbiEii/AbiGii toxin family protein [Sediminibacterium sp.]|nr:nucleotidyl transferase AbiEii/AbiGii toxin family protein [Sediminibacterium sp.]